MKIILHTRNHCSRGKGFGCQIINELPGFTGTTTPLAGIVAIIIVIDIIVNVIIITRPKPAYGRQGLAGSSLRASGAQLGSGK